MGSAWILRIRREKAANGTAVGANELGAATQNFSRSERLGPVRPWLYGPSLKMGGRQLLTDPR